ncbi:ABC transporter substrate-binding protein [Gordonia sp. ABSL1-1]|uniref:ABC transporter substrate-binding protein n=1 Tax=Gordonia sp. ABSL1-1 TaxID=3053923 RepID=UPI0025737C54|nr:ABC transporter substrate-binding protein [Gordonia sp. ABSL1-1]MDL9938107.1 ABC transporter substrate-binding protein [Gordonia sp. ABSL1-1]
MKIKGLRAAFALSASLAVVATTALAGCSSDDDTTDTASTTVQAPPGSFPGKAAAGDTVKIGLINPEDGPAISQPENREAAQAVVAYANENLGGIGGRPIELVICKNHEDPASARSCAQQMVEAKVPAVVVTASAVSTVLAPIITGAGINYASVIGSGPELTSDNAYIWSGGSMAYAYMAKYAAEQGLKKVTAYTIDVPAGIAGLQRVAEPAFAAANIEFKIVRIPPGTPEVTPQVTSGLTGGTDGAIVIGDTTLCTSIFKALGTQAPSIVKMTPQSCANPLVEKAVGASMNGTRVFSTADTVSDSPETQLYLAIMQKYAPGTDTQGYAVTGYQSMLGFVRAVAGINGTDITAESIRAAITSAKNVPLPAGDGLTFSCNQQAQPQLKAVCGKGMIVTTMQDGKATEPKVVQ